MAFAVAVSSVPLVAKEEWRPLPCSALCSFRPQWFPSPYDGLWYIQAAVVRGGGKEEEGVSPNKRSVEGQKIFLRTLTPLLLHLLHHPLVGMVLFGGTSVSVYRLHTSRYRIQVGKITKAESTPFLPATCQFRRVFIGLEYLY